MSDEEKQAVESLIEIREFANLSNYKDTKISQLNAIDIVLSLIDKQSKEIEELKEKSMHITKETVDFINSHYIHKDKIKAKIEELENQKKQWIEDRDNKHKDSEIIYAIEVLQSLLKDGGDI